MPLAVNVVVTPTVLNKTGGHKMVTIHATVNPVTSCAGDVSIRLTFISSDEPADAPGPTDGHTDPDIDGAAYGTADFEFQLRAEADRNGDGRTYTVYYDATDSSGAQAVGSATVTVPNNKGNQKPALVETKPNPKKGSPQR